MTQMANDRRIELRSGDITTVDVGAIVNAANRDLVGGGGVDGAIHRAGGPTILTECQKWVGANGRLGTGEAMITAGGDLVAKHVIHTVGPVWGAAGPRETDAQLALAYRSSLRLAIGESIESIAFPNISTGVFGYPKERAAGVALSALTAELTRHLLLRRVILVCHDPANYDFYLRLLGSD